MKKNIFNSVLCALLLATAGTALADLDVSLSGAKSFSSASGDITWVAGGAGSFSQVAAIDPSSGFATIANAQGIATYTAAGIGGSAGVAQVDTGAIGVADSSGASSTAGSTEQAQAATFNGVATTATAGQSSSLSIGPSSLAQSAA
ncbi:MAG: hypothetical protein PHT88_02700, partial [Candidatus Moranbacteria bacterium]|nr:hypothetical protein [Candidatus Moranbacteria bacterium]